MNQRFDMKEVQPQAYKAMIGLEIYLNGTELSNTHKDLIKVRASQINGCAYCINMHTRDARKHGETEQRIYLLNAWRETSLFRAEEKAILALTEEMTLLNGDVPDEVYQKAAELFSPTYLAQIIMAVVAINAWNRIGVTTRLQPD